MSTFQVLSSKAQTPAPPRKKRRHLSDGWATVIRIHTAMVTSALLFVTLLTITRSDYTFLLLPVFLSIFINGSRGYRFSKFLSNTSLYYVFTACLALIYYSLVAAGVLLSHFNSDTTHIILVTTALAWAVMFEPVRAYFQERIEQRFNVRHRETARVIEAFTSTLREEIDLAQLRERFLTVIGQTMQPYSLSFWVCISQEQQEKSALLEEVAVAEDDHLVAYLLSHSGITEVDKLQMESPLLREVKARGGEILLPLASQGELIGLLTLGVQLNGETYTREERGLLTTLASQVAPALRVAQMVREQQRQVRERERIEQELRTAQAIQQTFLPKEVPDFPGWQLAPYYQPAREVGGDFYDFLLFEDGRLGLVIGDVTGKGVPAALVMATVHTMLRSAALGTTSPGEALARVNDLLVAEIPAGMFVTCFYALLDPSTGRICYANAGHEAPYRRLNGSAVELPATGMPLGMLPGTRYEEYEATLAPGESLFFYSDGLVEAHNPSREMFGFPRLQTLLAGHAHKTSLIDFMLGELQSFTGDAWEQEDDVTLLTLQRAASRS